MSSGRSNKLVGQTGEYLVAAELSRRGLIATTFTGNVPHYDIIASDESGNHVAVQVKTTAGISWQFGNVSHYCDISFSGKQQIVGRRKPSPIKSLVFVFVKLDPAGADRYYLLTWEELCSLLVYLHTEFLLKHDGIRPQKWDSLHCALPESRMEAFRDRWDIVVENLH